MLVKFGENVVINVDNIDIIQFGKDKAVIHFKSKTTLTIEDEEALADMRRHLGVSAYRYDSNLTRLMDKAERG